MGSFTQGLLDFKFDRKEHFVCNGVIVSHYTCDNLVVQEMNGVVTLARTLDKKGNWMYIDEFQLSLIIYYGFNGRDIKFNIKA